MHTLTITIGRNIGTTPMPADEWDAFQVDVATDVFAVTGRDMPDTRHYGDGIWDGVREESCIASWFDVDLSPVQHADIVRRMSEYARHYGQDSIAVMYAPVVFA